MSALVQGSERTRRLSWIGMAVALAAVLSLFRLKLPHLLYGGSISLHMLPILLLAHRAGVRAGAVAGAAYGVVNFLLTPYFVHPVQLLLDYPVAFGVLGVAGGIHFPQNRTTRLALGIGSACLLRLAVHVVSGVVYFSDLTPAGTPVLIYALIYNSSYLIPETLLSLALALPLARHLFPGPTAHPGE